jgi:hypothetical protein
MKVEEMKILGGKSLLTTIRVDKSFLDESSQDKRSPPRSPSFLQPSC